MNYSNLLLYLLRDKEEEEVRRLLEEIKAHYNSFSSCGSSLQPSYTVKSRDYDYNVDGKGDLTFALAVRMRSVSSVFHTSIASV